MILNTNNYKEVCSVFYSRAKRWESNIPKNEPHAKEYVLQAIERCLARVTNDFFNRLRALLKQVQERCLQDMNA